MKSPSTPLSIPRAGRQVCQHTLMHDSTVWHTPRPPDTINKVQKGTQGIDGRVYNPRNKQEQVFVITLSRAGEDANFTLRDIDSTFAGFAGADYDLQVCGGWIT